MNTLDDQIFQQASSTYYFSAKLFPTQVREDVTKLYSFVRVADDYVDSIPQQADKFYQLRKHWHAAQNNSSFFVRHSSFDSIDQRVVKNIVHLTLKYKFGPNWIESFLDAMQSDLDFAPFKSLEDTLRYTHGSAEIIGLMMAKIMGLTEESFETAKLQGRAMQWLNFVRDIEEDNQLGRQYFPRQDLEKFRLTDLNMQTAHANPEDFKKFIHFQLNRYHTWQSEAQKGYKYIPESLLVPLQTAVEKYNLTAEQIDQDPLIVFRAKVKPNEKMSLKLI